MNDDILNSYDTGISGKPKGSRIGTATLRQLAIEANEFYEPSTPKKEDSFQYTLRMIKQDMFKRKSNYTQQQPLDIDAALDYALSPRGMGLV